MKSMEDRIIVRESSRLTVILENAVRSRDITEVLKSMKAITNKVLMIDEIGHLLGFAHGKALVDFIIQNLENHNRKKMIDAFKAHLPQQLKCN